MTVIVVVTAKVNSDKIYQIPKYEEIFTCSLYNF
jgi:hypothetical protein